MIYCIGHNIISSLGFTSCDNYRAVLSGQSGLRYYENTFDLPEPFFASLIDDKKLATEIAEIMSEEEAANYTKFELILIFSIIKANDIAGIDLKSPDTMFIISTTKGNVNYLSQNEDERIYLWHSAQKISRYFGNKNEPLVVSNACISGAAAQLEALRLIENGIYDNVVVAGCDLLSKFIISGFQSFKALSKEQCRPFDKEHCGLNLGEAGATVIYSPNLKKDTKIALVKAAARNDARHISAPSIEAEGLYNTLNAILKDVAIQDIAFVNAHGTATVYNDEMEALALNRAGLQSLPINSLKACFGHTLGAAGLLESIISMQAIENNTVLKSNACLEPDPKREIHPAMENMQTNASYFIKMVSGFGGSNAALLFKKIKQENNTYHSSLSDDLNIISYGRLSDDSLEINGENIDIKQDSENRLDNIYRSLNISYPKFFKMDRMCKAGFLVSELILRKAGFDTDTPKKDMAIAFFNRSASSDDDLAYLNSIDKDNYFPSPSVFVYTLPNIVMGEVAIRNKILGETAFYVTENLSTESLIQQVKVIMNDESCRYVLCGWTEYFKGHCDVMMCLVTKDNVNKISFNKVNINKLWKI